MRWQSLLDNTYSRLHPDQKVLIATRSGDVFLKAAHSPLPAGATHHMAIEAVPKPWWEELPEEAVWFELETHPDRGSYAANECFARHPNGTYWHRLLSEEDAAVETWAQRYPEGRLIRWQ